MVQTSLLQALLPVLCVASLPWGPDPLLFANHSVWASSDAWSGGVTPARVFGRGYPGEQITVTGLPAGAVQPANPFTVPASGNFSVTVAVPASLAAYTIAFTGANASVTVADVLFGHTILCSGQSNVDMNVGCTYTANQSLADCAAYPEIRGMNQGATGRWAPLCGEAALSPFSATCYYTALHLKQSIPAFAQVPIGLVRSSVGGQVIERFMTPAAMEAVGVPAANATGQGCEGQLSHTLYDQLIQPLQPFVFKTLVWYQGESNVACNNVSTPAWEHLYYSRLLPQLVTTWRAAFDTQFAALVVQLAAWGYDDAVPPQRSSDAVPVLRNSQLAVLALPNTAVAVAIDLGDDGSTIPIANPSCPFRGGIHPRNKTEVGRRLALRLAELEGVLPPGALATGPVATDFSASAGGVTLSFAAASIPAGFLQLLPTADCAGLTRPAATSNCCQVNSTSENLAGFPFELRLGDGATYVLAAATVDSDGGFATVGLAPLRGEPGPFTGVRYSWQSFPLCSLVNQQGLPMGPFVKEL